MPIFKVVAVKNKVCQLVRNGKPLARKRFRFVDDDAVTTLATVELIYK